MSDTKVEVGRFTYDTETGTTTGPADYMRERFADYVKEVESGRHSYLAAFAPQGQSPVVTFLVGVQTDYAGFVGARQVFRAVEAMGEKMDRHQGVTT